MNIIFGVVVLLLAVLVWSLGLWVRFLKDVLRYSKFDLADLLSRQPRYEILKDELRRGLFQEVRLLERRARQLNELQALEPIMSAHALLLRFGSGNVEPQYFAEARYSFPRIVRNVRRSLPSGTSAEYRKQALSWATELQDWHQAFMRNARLL